MKKKQVVLAMSGGVDSSVAAYLLKKQGYSVIGVTFKVWPKNLCGKHARRSCCSVDAIADARSVCAKLGIPHYAIDCEKEFKRRVIDHFINSYKRGLTPNPCIICNEEIKFPILLKKARQTKSDYIATGHHARCVYNKKHKRFVIKEGKDKKKEQSYVLFSLNQDILSHLILPVGDYTKDKIRAIAKRLKFASYSREESQEICFVMDNNLNKFLKEKLKKKDIRPGIIKNKDGAILGKHPGTCFYTIGQRRGLKISCGKPIYITDINHKKGEIVIGDYNDTLKKTLRAKDINWIIPPKKSQKLLHAEARTRYKEPKAKASLKPLSSKTCEVRFSKPQSSPTPGQAVVFYKGDTVIAGAWIT
ncbi:MAG: tRNA 2-thiouridine(34) synthase MnmA [Candidatus Omnitrophica bacterium]|nr:tRNA 2-thiouridine(34) synthase MnmA [Candidatus Omnitrophota bacterium]